MIDEEQTNRSEQRKKKLLAAKAQGPRMLEWEVPQQDDPITLQDIKDTTHATICTSVEILAAFFGYEYDGKPRKAIKLSTRLRA